ncbi:MAG: sulfatase-like hydrolase/transferase [Planctomycetes bacterium]|nr:sulfatase-like hydrolase/transferase [Planctomycetota bacterium]
MPTSTLAPALALCLFAAAARGQANLLIVVADDLGVDGLSAYAEGNDLPTTPVIDQLAAGGLCFRNCWANPACSPTRATLQTGRYALRTGMGHVVDGGTYELPLAELTLPEALNLQTPGAWATAAIGKWHLGRLDHPLHPNLSGYGHFSGSLGNLGPVGGYATWTKVVDGVSSVSTTYPTTDTVDEALAWIATAPEPWLCYVAFNAPHAPFHAPPQGLYHVTLPNVDPREVPRPFYKAAIEALDSELGRLLGGVGVMSGATNVVFLGDNGTPREVCVPPFLPNHAKLTPYEGGVNVPLVVWGPAVQAPGQWCDALVCTTDLFATALELAGASLPPGLVPADSVSLAPYLAAPGRPSLRAFAYAEHFRPNGPPPHHLQRTMVRDARYKLIRTSRAAGGDELYDLGLDRYEVQDLLAPAHAQLTATEASALARLRAEMARVQGL